MYSFRSIFMWFLSNYGTAVVLYDACMVTITTRLQPDCRCKEREMYQETSCSWYGAFR